MKPIDQDPISGLHRLCKEYVSAYEADVSEIGRDLSIKLIRMKLTKYPVKLLDRLDQKRDEYKYSRLAAEYEEV